MALSAQTRAMGGLGYSWLLFAVLWDLTNSLQIESPDLILLCMQRHSSAWICENSAFAKLQMLGVGCRPRNQALKALNKGVGQQSACKGVIASDPLT